MRGALVRLLTVVSKVGIIPACAGSTISLLLDSCMDGDHPRMCGEHASGSSMVSSKSGSSPHVRGALAAEPAVKQVSGIIPACAGSTTSSRAQHCQSRDHPRMCGEHLWHDGTKGNVWGSSPHVRGAHAVVRGGDPDGGIIPACAGSTRRSAPARPW